MPKRGGTIVLDEEMRGPSESVGGGNRNKQEPVIPSDECRDETRPAEKRPREVKHASQRLAVRQHVVRPKFGKRAGFQHAEILI